MDCPAQGNRNYIPVSDLYTRNFTDLNGEFQLELSMGHVRTVFDTEFRMPSHLLTLTRGVNPAQAKLPPKIESSYFNFGGFDWNLALYPHGTKDIHADKYSFIEELERLNEDTLSDISEIPTSSEYLEVYFDSEDCDNWDEKDGGEKRGYKTVSPQRPHSLEITPTDYSRSGPTIFGEKGLRRRSSASPQRRLPDLHGHEIPQTSITNSRYASSSSPPKSGDKYSSRRKKSVSPQRRLPEPHTRYSDSHARHQDSHARHPDSHSRHPDSHARHPDSHARHPDSHARHLDPHARHSEPPHVLELPDSSITPGSSPSSSPTSGGAGENRLSFYLNRCTGFDHQCRVRYSVTLGDGERRLDSGIVDDVSDSDGKSYGWHPRSRFSDLIYKGAIRVHLEMILANTLSEVIANIVVQQNASSGNPMGVVAQGMTQCYDRDKLAWSIKTDSHSETVRLHMVYKEIHNVPRNHLRYVSWTAYVLRYHGKHVEPIPLPGVPFSHYYAQDVSDEGIIMETDIGMKELREVGCPYLSDKGQLRIQVEWEESYMLFQATYHKYDDVGRIHNQQMRKEITALQAENYSLERQLFSYQKSIAFAHSRGTYSDDLVSPECRGEEEDERFYEERAYSLGDRSLSTDTEYA